MPMINLQCGCQYNSLRKAYVRYCPQHLNNVVAVNLKKQQQLNEQIIQQKALRQAQKSDTFRIKPLFAKDRRYFKKLF